ncbi:MAG: helix-turn-helix domain-containing protein [Desulfomonilaceae bacterium]
MHLCMPKAAESLPMIDEQRKQLETWLSARKTSRGLALRAQICLLAADGLSNSAIAKELNTSRPTVILWRKRFEDQGPKGLTKDAPHGPSSRRLEGAKYAMA